MEMQNLELMLQICMSSKELLDNPIKETYYKIVMDFVKKEEPTWNLQLFKMGWIFDEDTHKYTFKVVGSLNGKVFEKDIWTMSE